MSLRKLTEQEFQRRVERGHPTSQIARLAAIPLKARWRWTGDKWMGFNALSGRFSEASAFAVGAMVGLSTADTARKALGGSDAAMDAALASPDWPNIESMVRILLAPGSKFLNAPTEAPTPAQPQGQRRGLQRVPPAPAGARTRHRQSRVAAR